MTFTEWYKATYDEDWHEDYAWLIGLETMDGYEKWCEENNQIPVWNG